MRIPCSRFSLPFSLALSASTKLRTGMIIGTCFLLIPILSVILTHEVGASSLTENKPKTPTESTGGQGTPCRTMPDIVIISGSPIRVLVHISGIYSVCRNEVEQFYNGFAEGSFLCEYTPDGDFNYEVTRQRAISTGVTNIIWQ